MRQCIGLNYLRCIFQIVSVKERNKDGFSAEMTVLYIIVNYALKYQISSIETENIHLKLWKIVGILLLPCSVRSSVRLSRLFFFFIKLLLHLINKHTELLELDSIECHFVLSKGLTKSSVVMGVKE